MHSVGLPSKLFIYLHSLSACDVASEGTPGNSSLKYFVLLLRRLGHPRPVLSPSASRVGFQGEKCSQISNFSTQLPFFLLLFNIEPSVKPLSPVISGKGSVLAWPALPTCLWRVSWSVVPAWSPWAFSPLPTHCCIGTCTSWRTRSGKFPLGMGLAIPCLGEGMFLLWWAVLGKWEFSDNALLWFPWLAISPENITGSQCDGEKELISSSLFLPNRLVKCYPNPSYCRQT